MSNKIPTAEELLYNTLLEGISERKPEWEGKEMYAKTLSSPIPTKNYGKEGYGHDMQPHDTVSAMIAFAQLHVKAALKAAKAHVEEIMEGSTHMSGDILIIYPKENIL